MELPLPELRASNRHILSSRETVHRFGEMGIPALELQPKQLLSLGALEGTCLLDTSWHFSCQRLDIPGESQAEWHSSSLQPTSKDSGAKLQPQPHPGQVSQWSPVLPPQRMRNAHPSTKPCQEQHLQGTCSCLAYPHLTLEEVLRSATGPKCHRQSCSLAGPFLP